MDFPIKYIKPNRIFNWVKKKIYLKDCYDYYNYKILLRKNMLFLSIHMFQFTVRN